MTIDSHRKTQQNCGVLDPKGIMHLPLHIADVTGEIIGMSVHSGSFGAVAKQPFDFAQGK